MPRIGQTTNHDPRAVLHHGDCLDVMRTMRGDSIDSVVTDPPYGLSFMGKNWDHGVPGESFWREALRVAKPGAHLLAFGGTRTYHRLACAIEDAGWEIRDCIMWVYGSGFPKSHDVSKAIDKAAGAEREVVGTQKGKGGENLNTLSRNGNDAENAKGCGAYGQGAKQITVDIPITAPATDAARQWQGWGTALKPAYEPVILARKPLIGTVAANVLAHGTGAINVDACRVGTVVETWPATRAYSRHDTGNAIKVSSQPTGNAPSGRWPANLIHDGSDEATAGFPHTTSGKPIGKRRGTSGESGIYGSDSCRSGSDLTGFGDTGSAARFFYCAKTSKADREEGNNHPTVKPTALMRYLCRLVTPPNGVILDPFLGSGSTGKAALLEGFRFVGIEQDEESYLTARKRVLG